MGKPAARLSDMHTCPMVTGVVPHVGGPLLPPFQVTVLTGMLPQARIGDMAVCVGPPDMIALGSFTVLVVGKPAARMGDMTVHGGIIVKGEPTVLIGEAGAGTSSAPGSAGMLPIGVEGKGVAAAEMAKARIEAAKRGVPFCEQCFQAAHKGT